MKEEKISLDYRTLYDYVKVTVEYTFIDTAEVVPGREAWGQKLASTQDWYFKIHFPGNPIMPGVFIMESIMTTGSLIVYTMEGKKNIQLLFNGCESVKLYNSVRPGDILRTHVVLERYRSGFAKFDGEAFVDDKLVCKMKFILIAPEEFPKRTEAQ